MVELKLSFAVRNQGGYIIIKTKYYVKSIDDVVNVKITRT